MKARENSGSKGHGYDYWTSSGRDFCYVLILKWVGVVYNNIKKKRKSVNGHPSHPLS